MAFLEADVQGSDHICHDIMDDITAIEDESAESREFVGNAHSVVITAEGVTIECTIDDPDDEASSDQQAAAKSGDNTTANTQKSGTDNAKDDASTTTPTKFAKNSPTQYQTGLKHFREILEDWEAFILDDQSLT